MNDFPIEKIYVRYKNGTKLEYSLTTPLHQLRLIVPPPPPLVWGVWEVKPNEYSIGCIYRIVLCYYSSGRIGVHDLYIDYKGWCKCGW